MTSPTGTIRPLFFPLDASLDLVSDTPNEPPIDHITLEDWQTTDPDERVNIVLNLSLNEYVALATCVDVGRDIAYGDESLYLWWIWVRGIKYMNICDLILDCINDTESIQQAIANYAGGSSINGSNTENATNLASELINNPTGCDNDIIFGMCVQLVEFADRLIKDLFEQLSASQLSSENVGYLIKLIPVVETLPLDEAFELAGKLVNDMETAYLSASTELLKDAIACDLFCLAQANGCVLTLEMVRDYFEEQAGVVFTYSDVFSFLVDFINGTFIGNAVYYGMNILFFQIFVFAGRFLEYFYKDYLRTIQSMYNDPNPDWVTICDACPSAIEVEYDFTIDNQGWNIEPRDGTGWTASYNTTAGWHSALSMSISKDTTIGVDINVKSIEFNGTPDRQYNLGFFDVSGYPDTEFFVYVTTDATGLGVATVNWNVPSGFEPFVARFGTANYRQITYIKYSGLTL